MPDRDVVEGKVKQGVGRAQQKFGEATGDRLQQQKGLDKQAEGKAQEGVGKIKDAARDMLDTVKRNI